MYHLLRITVQLSDRPLQILKWCFIAMILLTPVFLFYRYMRNLHRRSQELVILQKTLEINILQAEIRTQENIFREISKEVHDNVGQKLAVAHVYALQENVSPQDNKQIGEILFECMQDLRDLTKSMSSDHVRDNGLVVAIEDEIARLESAALFRLDFQVSGNISFLNVTFEITLFRIFQEALQNAVKHSGASSVFTELTFEPKQVVLSITDNGIGITGRHSAGRGLKNMEERAATLGGSFHIRPKDPGTQILVTLPITST